MISHLFARNGISGPQLIAKGRVATPVRGQGAPALGMNMGPTMELIEHPSPRDPVCEVRFAGEVANPQFEARSAPLDVPQTLPPQAVVLIVKDLA